MRLPTASELITVWETGQSLTPVERGLCLLAALFPDESDADLANYTIGERDGWLLTLREQIFGPEVASVATCPHCGESLESNFLVSEIRVQDVAPSEKLGAEKLGQVVTQAQGYAIRCRLPTSADLLAVADRVSAEDAQRALLERCILTIVPDETAEAPPTLDQLPSNVVEIVVEQMARADPQADVQLALVCPACSHEWLAEFDILSFLWTELADWVQRTLHEVHQLASAYSWREADILAMSAWRRQWYLALIGE